MRYIRTVKGDIIDFKKLKAKLESDLTASFTDDEYSIYHCIITGNYNSGFKRRVLKSSDDIEDLFDVIVLFLNEELYDVVRNSKEAAELALGWKSCKAAVLTDWGLKFVAKPNADKKKWELL